MENVIRHDGIIESIEGSNIKVRIITTTPTNGHPSSKEEGNGCASCKVASHCHASEAKEKIVDVSMPPDSHEWRVGQSVVIFTQASMAGKALLIGFGLPLLLMLIVLAVTMAAGCSEGMVAMLMLGSLLPYYLIVWLLREKLARQLSFQIEVRSWE